MLLVGLPLLHATLLPSLSSSAIVVLQVAAEGQRDEQGYWRPRGTNCVPESSGKLRFHQKQGCALCPIAFSTQTCSFSINYYYKVCCLLAGPWTYGRYVFLPYVRLINCRFLLFRSSASSFSSQYLLLFLKSSGSCVPLLPTPFTSIICPSMASRRRQFLLRI